MKTCPVCKARCFDDMEICYGCMHRFEDIGPAPGTVVAAGGETPQQTAVFRSVADPFDGREEVSTQRSAANVANQAPAACFERDVSCLVDTCPESTTFSTPPFSLEELFAGKEFRLEIKLCSCRKE